MRKTLTAQSAFYPAAALYAVLALPASVLALTGRASGLQGLASPMGHAHEMLFGFALAVVAGNQLGPSTGPSIIVLLALWAAARVAFVVAPATALAAVPNAAFAAALALRVAPRLFAAAKKARNLALPGALAGLCAAAVAWDIARYGNMQTLPRSGLLATLMLFSLLMLFMGGRIIAPAVAGQFYRQGAPLDARVQPRLERGLIVACIIGIGALLIPHAEAVAVAACEGAGVLAAVRLVRWRLWAVRTRPDLLCLASGYGWLALGLLALGAALAAGRYENAAIHLITIGALGTLTLNVMAMSWLRRARRPPERSAANIWGTMLLAAATACRVLGAFYPQPWLLVAAWCWAAAFALLLSLFWRVRRRD